MDIYILEELKQDEKRIRILQSRKIGSMNITCETP